MVSYTHFYTFFNTTMFKNIFFLFLSFLFFLFLFVRAANAGTASMQISPLQGRYEVGEKFTVNVWLKTGDYAIGQVVTDVSYSEDFLEVVSLKLADIFEATNKYGKNNYDNEKGNIHIEGKASVGMREDGRLASIIFKAKKNGSGRVEVVKTSKIYTLESLQIPLKISSSLYQLSVSGGAASQSDVQQADDNVIVSDEGWLVGITNSISTSSVLIGQPPYLAGKTDAASARIEFNIDEGLAVDRVYADQDGNWSWYLPRNLLPGVYAVKITAINPQDSKKRKIDWQEVEVRLMDVSRSLYKIAVVSSTLPKKISTGAKLPFTLKISHVNSAGDSKQLQNTFIVAYYIEDASHSIVYDEKETVNFTGSDLKIDRVAEVDKDAVEGQYTIYTSMKLGDDLISADSATFTVRGGSFKYFIIIGLLAVIVIIIGVLFKMMKK